MLVSEFGDDWLAIAMIVHKQGHLALLTVTCLCLIVALGVPDAVVQAGLELVARLTDCLAKALGISLPHPLQFPASCCHATISEDHQRRWVQHPIPM